MCLLKRVKDRSYELQHVLLLGDKGMPYSRLQLISTALPLHWYSRNAILSTTTYILVLPSPLLPSPPLPSPPLLSPSPPLLLPSPPLPSPSLPTQLYLRETTGSAVEKQSTACNRDCSFYYFGVKERASGTVIGAIAMMGFYINFDREDFTVTFWESACSC